MNVRPFPPAGARPGAGHHSVDIDHLLTLTNTRLVRMTGDPDVIGTRLGLRKLKSLGLKALVYGRTLEALHAQEAPCANDEGRG